LERSITVIGDVPVTPTLAPGARGAAVVVAAAGEDVRVACRLSPAAVLLLVDATPDQVGEVLDATLCAPQRVVGVPRADAGRVAQALAEGRDVPVRATLRPGPRDVTLGRGGVVSL
jgi:hypothetical protein